RPTVLATGDLNGDGLIDIVVANSKTNTVTILPNQGARGPRAFSFTPSSVSVGAGLRAAAVGDFNLDGKRDLALVSSTSDELSLLLGNGSGALSLRSSIATGDGPLALTIVDLDGDGASDAAVANQNSGNVSV